MVTFLLKKSYQHKNLKEVKFQDLWGDHGIFTTMWIFGKPPKILFFDNHIRNLIRSLTKYRIKKKKLNIGYFGSLYKSRGLDLIIKLALIDPKNNYYIYGNKKQVKLSNSDKIKKNLYLNDYVPYKKIPKILLNMDLLLMPYTSSITVSGDVGNITKYTSPLKLFDYLSVGRPIMCSNYDVLREIITENKNAIFVKNYKNATSWKNEITKLINKPEKMKIISKNNYKLSKKYSHNVRATKILNIIK